MHVVVYCTRILDVKAGSSDVNRMLSILLLY